MKANLKNDDFFLRLIEKGILKVYKNGKILNTRTGNFIGAKTGEYIRVGYTRPGKKTRFIGQHRLVCLAYKGKIPQHLIPNHKNGIKTNNRLSNLELVTYSGNIQHAYDTGLNEAAREHCRKLGKARKGIKGDYNPLTKTSDKKARRIRKDYLSVSSSMRAIAQKYGISLERVHYIVNKRKL